MGAHAGDNGGLRGGRGPARVRCLTCGPEALHCMQPGPQLAPLCWTHSPEECIPCQYPGQGIRQATSSLEGGQHTAFLDRGSDSACWGLLTQLGDIWTPENIVSSISLLGCPLPSSAFGKKKKKILILRLCFHDPMSINKTWLILNYFVCLWLLAGTPIRKTEWSWCCHISHL